MVTIREDIAAKMDTLNQDKFCLDLVLNELCRARDRFPDIHSPHEGIAIIREEYLELEAEIFHGTADAAAAEAIQVAAMAIRLLTDLYS